MKQKSLGELTKHLFKLQQEAQKWMTATQANVQVIQKKHNPRKEFERWRDSQDGQLWKQRTYQAQNRCCAICGQKIKLKGSHIDHIKPICQYPALALEITNLRITCETCNITRKF